jgi:hypothetical protein
VLRGESGIVALTSIKFTAAVSDAEKNKIGRKAGGAYYVSKGVPKVTRKTPVITVSSWRDAQLGIAHGKAAKLQKEKRLGYGPRGETNVAPQSVRTREKLIKPVYGQPWEHTYINTVGDVSYDFFWKHGLRHMQDYQHAFDIAIALDAMEPCCFRSWTCVGGRGCSITNSHARRKKLRRSGHMQLSMVCVVWRCRISSKKFSPVRHGSTSSFLNRN